jgi:hypothetical protein
MIGDSYLPPIEGGSPGKPQFLQMNGRCPVCSNMFDFRKLHILFEHNGASLLHITCQNCHSSTLAQVQVGQGGVQFSGIVTDLNITDVLKFKEMESLSSDFVMDLHEALEHNTLEV